MTELAVLSPLSTKQQTRLRRRRRRRRVARWLLFVLIFLGLTASAVPPQTDLMTQVNALTAPLQFDFIDWMSLALVNEAERRIDPTPIPENYEALVELYLSQEDDIDRLRQNIDEILADPAHAWPGQNPLAMQKELADLQTAQAAIIPSIENIFSRQIEAVLHDEGFHVIPPVAFRLIDPPTALIISPRDKIERQHFVGLSPGLDPATRTDIENTLQQRGDVSAYVTDVGGLGSYPTMVINHGWLPTLIDIVAHEWVHNYLYTFPTNMAWGYGTSRQMTTLNETTASLVGGELARKVITRFYPDWADQLPPLDEHGQEAPAQPSEFNLAMRRIRQHVDDLLAAGKIDEAEAYMESERQKLAEQGHSLRRLNQAYFAFHGSYALSPGSVDPIGPQLRQLRAASPSLKAFLDRIGWLNSPADYERWLQQTGLPTSPQPPKAQ